MSGASTGLQKALARAGTSVVAIAEMTADDLISQMTDDQRTALAATLARKASADAPAGKVEAKPGEDDSDGDDGAMKDKDKDKDMSGSDASADALAKARAEGFTAGTARAVAVMTHEDFGGRADSAAKLLGNAKLSSLSSDEIVELMAGEPDADAAKMRAALDSDKTPPLGADVASTETAKAENHGWKKAAAKINDRFFPQS